MIATSIQIRFADVDMGGHVHNAAYLHYFESARINFFIGGLGSGWDWKKNGFIVKKNVIEYHIPVYITDEIRVEVSSTHIGEKSFTLSYHIFDKAGNLKTNGESVIVCLDYLAGKTIPIPAEVKKILTSHFVPKTTA
ncbi:MAG: acyl-CoA thioesterase [Bacteroidetes bacterium]|nr:acyl-CoA thioesterase [Bacteroidota bacterium]